MSKHKTCKQCYYACFDLYKNGGFHYSAKYVRTFTGDVILYCHGEMIAMIKLLDIIKGNRAIVLTKKATEMNNSTKRDLYEFFRLNDVNIKDEKTLYKWVEDGNIVEDTESRYKGVWYE